MLCGESPTLCEADSGSSLHEFVIAADLELDIHVDALANMVLGIFGSGNNTEIETDASLTGGIDLVAVLKMAAVESPKFANVAFQGAKILFALLGFDPNGIRVKGARNRKPEIHF